MMKSPTLFVGANDKAIVWRFKKPGVIEFLAFEKGSSGFFTKGREGERMHTCRPEVEDPVLVVYAIANAEDPNAALEQCRQAGRIASKDGKLTAGARVFDEAWLNLVQPPAERELFSAPKNELLTTLEF